MGRLILFEAGPGVKVLNLSQRRCGGSNRGPPYQVQPLAPLNQHSVGVLHLNDRLESRTWELQYNSFAYE